jgi:hypothetical protein
MAVSFELSSAATSPRSICSLELVAGGLRGQRVMLASAGVDGLEVDVWGASLEQRVPSFGLGIFCHGFIRNFERG